MDLIFPSELRTWSFVIFVLLVSPFFWVWIKSVKAETITRSGRRRSKRKRSR